MELPAQVATRPEQRIGDVERERTASVISAAAADGYLTLIEVDDRLDAVWSARTRSELDQVTADLPPAARGTTPRPEPQVARRIVSKPVASYLAGMTLMVVIWLTVALSSGAWYPWVVWPALGWGLAVAKKTARRPISQPSSA